MRAPFVELVSVFALALACFVAGHAAVLAGFVAARWLRLSARVDRAGARYAVEFVCAEALMLTAAIELGVIRLSAFSAWRAALTLGVASVWWELWFYVGHRLLHTRWLYPLHRPHHAMSGVHPSLCFSALETCVLSCGFYAPLALASRLLGGVSPVTLALVFSLAYALNVVSHLDADRFGAGYESTAWRHALNSPRYHAAHHAGRRGNYGLNTPWVDRAFGTELRAEGGPLSAASARGAARRARGTASPPTASSGSTRRAASRSPRPGSPRP